MEDTWSSLNLKNRDTLHTEVCNVLRKLILEGELTVGDRLKQSELAEKLGVSRMPIREALKKLEQEGFISITPHKGAIVNDLNKEDIQEIYSLRATLEKMALIQGANKINSQDISYLEQLISEMEEMNNINDFVTHNIKFHNALIQHCSWERLLSFIKILWNGFPQQTPYIIKDQVEKSHNEHMQIVQYLKENEIEKASEILAHHISRTGSIISNRFFENNNKS